MDCRFYDAQYENVGLPGELALYEEVGRCAAYSHVKCGCCGKEENCQFNEPPDWVNRYFKYEEEYDRNEYCDVTVRQYYCGKCNTSVDETDIYCRHCGNKLQEDA